MAMYSAGAVRRRLQPSPPGQTPTQTFMKGKSAGSMMRAAPKKEAPSTQNPGTDQKTPGKKSPAIKSKSQFKVSPGAIQRRMAANNAAKGSSDNDADDPSGSPKPNPNAPVGQGGRFAAMVASGKSPALAAFIGRRKYGASRFQKMAAAGR